MFSSDATYRHSPWKDPIEGVDAIVADWLNEPDSPGSWEASYRAAYGDGDHAIIMGEMAYAAEGHRYANLFEVGLIDGWCASFIEWHMRMPNPK